MSVSAAGKPVYTHFDQSEKPVLEIYFYYSNPCSSCTEVRDFEQFIWDSGKAFSDKVSLRVFTLPAYTTAGKQKIESLLDNHQAPQNERNYSDVVQIGRQLLLKQIETELPAVMAAEAKFLLENKVGPTLPAETTQSPQPVGASQYSTDLIFFSSDACENCRKAAVLITEIEEKTNLAIIRYDIERDAVQFRAIVDQYQIATPAVPIIIYQDKLWIGYNSFIVQEIRTAAGLENTSEKRSFFTWNIDKAPLVLSTAIIGLTDGFNPCSLWALLFLISMIIRFQSRRTMLTVGLTYILVVTVIYGLFILGIFEIVTYMTDIIWLRIPLFVLAFFFGASNVFSFFSRSDPLVSISNDNKKRFVQQIRARLYAQTGLTGLVAATILIALLASLIELPCTAGFPVIWNALMSKLSASQAIYLPLLGLYLLMYVLDEIIVVAIMTYTMKKLYINQMIGRSLKLISGLLMVYLAIMLLLGNVYLNSSAWVVGGSVMVIVFAAALSLFMKNSRINRQ